MQFISTQKNKSLPRLLFSMFFLVLFEVFALSCDSFFVCRIYGFCCILSVWHDNLVMELNVIVKSALLDYNCIRTYQGSVFLLEFWFLRPFSLIICPEKPKSSKNALQILPTGTSHPTYFLTRKKLNTKTVCC